MRGIIGSHPNKFTPHQQKIGGFLDQSQLRFWALYWDRIDLPQPRSCYIGSGAVEIDELKAAGFLTETRGDYIGSGGADELVLSSVQFAFDTNEKKEPGSWSVATGHGCLEIEYPEIELGRSLQFKLANCVPAPKEHTPIDRIIEFKQRHNAERVAFLAHIDELYLDIIRSPDRPLAEQVSFAKLQQGMSDIEKSARSSNSIQFSRADMTAKFDLIAGASTAVVSAIGGASMVASIGVGAVAALSVSLGPKLVFGRKAPANAALEYVAKIDSRLEWD